MKLHSLKGFTMVEALVTVVIIAIGLLGVASIQATAISNTAAARNRSMAALEIDALASMMHANPRYWQSSAAVTSVAGYTVSATTGTNQTVTIGNSGLNSLASNCSTNNCSPIQMAAYDISTWAQSAVNALPAASTGNIANIQCSQATSAPVICTIIIFWAENSLTGKAASNQSYQLMVEP
jgi:type IV pilus assembly protein PilV